MAGAISLTLSTVISTAPASGSLLRGFLPQSNNLSAGINGEKKNPKPLNCLDKCVCVEMDVSV